MVLVERKRAGFTLIELLVVIAIIAILAAILFPMLLAAKQKAQQSTCCSNMMQIGKAITMYTDENHGYTPFGYYVPNWGIWNKETWRERIVPYLKGKHALTCPIRNYKPSLSHFPQPDSYWPDYGKHVHYGMNIDIIMPAGYRLMSSVTLASQTILVTENKDGDWSGEPWDNAAGDEGEFWPYHGTVQNPAGNFTFCDGHAVYMTVARAQMTLSGVSYYYWKAQKIPG